MSNLFACLFCHCVGCCLEVVLGLGPHPIAVRGAGLEFVLRIGLVLDVARCLGLALGLCSSCVYS